MKNYKLLSLIALTAAFSCSPNNEDGQSGNTPVEKYGALKVSGIQLCAQNGKALQLRGMSTHGLQWFGKCQTEEAYRSLAEEWQCDVVRLALYAEENGYNTDPLKFRNKIETLVGYCEKYGMYCIIDWHVLHPGDPNDPKYDTADDFFAWASKKFAGKPHVLYEICNEPNGDEVTWAVVKRYAERVIPIIRANSPNAVVICGTPKWSADFTDVVKDPLTYKNILYTYRFYAASHYNYDNLQNYLDRLPVFVTEWGTCEYNGSGKYDLDSSQRWIQIMDGDNPGKQRVSWATWNFSDGEGTADNLVPGSCAACRFTNVKQPYGQFIRDRIREKRP